MISRNGQLAIGLCLASVFCHSAAGQEIRTVMILKNEITVKVGSGPTLSLTDDGQPKAVPVWSKDGTRIAFIQRTNPANSLAKLVVIDTNGHVTSETTLKPYSLGLVPSGMRYVEALEWLANDRLTVSGPVNPSTTEYDIVEMSRQTVMKEFFDDGHGAAFSPDGQHYAYVSGSPHFTPAAERVPTLNVDNAAIFSERGSFLDFAAAPQWSEDSSSLAVLAAAPQTGQQRVIVWHAGSASAYTVGLPSSPGGIQSVFWHGNELYAVSVTQARPSPHQKAWVLQSGTRVGVWELIKTAEIPNAVAQAEGFRERLTKTVQADGAREPDFWCENCQLTILPRQSRTR